MQKKNTGLVRSYTISQFRAERTPHAGAAYIAPGDVTSLSSKQWAAVSSQRWLMSDAPQKWCAPPQPPNSSFTPRDTSHGQCSSTSAPLITFCVQPKFGGGVQISSLLWRWKTRTETLNHRFDVFWTQHLPSSEKVAILQTGKRHERKSIKIATNKLLV